MGRKVVTGIMLTLLLVGVLTWVFDSSSAFYQPPATQWNKTYGGASEDGGHDGKQTNDGGYIIAGHTFSFGAGGMDAWLVKVDSTGNHQWNKTYGGAGWEYASAVEQTNDGGYIIAGYTNSSGAGGDDFWLVKTDGSGNQEWNKTYGGASRDWAYGAEQTNDEGYIIAGITNSSGAGGINLWLVKTDSDGNHEWNKTYGAGWASAVEQTNDGGYIIAGYTGSPPGAGGRDFWLVKVDSTGNHQWNKTYGGASTDWANDVARTSDEGYIVAGLTNSFGAVSGDFWLVKTDSSGDHQWNKTYGGANLDLANSVVQTSDGGYMVSGYTFSSGAGGMDVWLVRTDGSGNQEWNKTYGGANNDWASSIVQTSDEGYIIAGNTESSGAGGRDFWLIKLAHEVVIIIVDSIVIKSNATITNVGTTSNALNFRTSGLTGQRGYINVTMPVGLNTTAIKVFIDGQELIPPPWPIITTNGTHYFIYFEFTHSTHEITIEYAPSPAVGGIWFPVDKLALLASYIALASTIIVTTAATAIYIKHAKRRKKKQ